LHPPECHGILGFDVLRRFPAMEMDFDAHAGGPSRAIFHFFCDRPWHVVSINLSCKIQSAFSRIMSPFILLPVSAISFRFFRRFPESGFVDNLVDSDCRTTFPPLPRRYGAARVPQPPPAAPPLPPAHPMAPAGPGGRHHPPPGPRRDPHWMLLHFHPTHVPLSQVVCVCEVCATCCLLSPGIFFGSFLAMRGFRCVSNNSRFK